MMASALLLLAAAAAAAPAPLPHPAMTQYLVELSDWIMTLDVGSNVLRGDFTPAADPTHIFINGNFATARALLPRILLARAAHVHLVVSATADIDRFTNCTGLRPTRVERIAPMDAFPLDYERLKQGWQAVAGGDVVIFCAGPLGRLLAIAWHARQPAATYLELGSFFDPDLAPPERAFFRRRGRNRGARYYPQVQCGVRVNESLYVARTHHPGCQTVRDVRAAIDEAAIWRALKRAP